jgi:hypothetical protein
MTMTVAVGLEAAVAKMNGSCLWLLVDGLVVSPFSACPQPSILDFGRSKLAFTSRTKCVRVRISRVRKD